MGAYYQYPLQLVLTEIAGDNGLEFLPSSEFPNWIDYTYINDSLRKLRRDELIVFAIGEQTKQDMIAVKYNLDPQINEFFNAVFDGQLTRYFFK